MDDALTVKINFTLSTKNDQVSRLVKLKILNYLYDMTK